MPSELDLNLLRVFDALVRTASVTDAAEHLHLSIPATSRSLGRLRRAVGDPVLVRAGRGMVATPFAVRAAPRVRALLEEAAALASGERGVRPDQLARTFTLRINDGVAATFIATVSTAVTRAAAGVTLRFLAEGTEDDEDLRNGTADYDVGQGDDPPPDIRSVELYSERLVGVVRHDHPLGRRPHLPALCRYPHVSASRRGRARGPLDDVLAAEGLSRRVAVTVPSLAVAALVVAGSDYVGLVPRRLAEQQGAALGLRWFPLPAALPELSIRLRWHARLDADPAHRWLRETVLAALARGAPGDQAGR